MERTLLDALAEGFSKVDPNKPAVLGTDAQLSYGELFAGARGIAAALAEAGIGRGSRVGLWMDKTPAAVQALLGVLYSGAAYVPLDPRSPWPRTRTIALDCQLAGMVVDSAKFGLLPEFLDGQSPRLVLLSGDPAELPATLPETLRFEALAEATARPALKLPSPEAGELAYILYTSGSTGVPKGVVHTHASGVAFVDWVRDTFGTGPEDVFSSHAPFHFDLSISDLFAALASGASVRLLSATEGMLPAYLARMIEPWGITVWYSVPSVLVAMLEAGLEKAPPRGLKILFFAGEVFATAQLRRLRKALPQTRLYNLFGPTETNVCTYYQVPEQIPEEQTAPIPIGKGCEHMETFVLDDEGREQRQVGEQGTLWARGGNLMQGYWNDAERTARTLFQDPRRREGVACCTGDQVRLLPDGNYEFLGRRDHMVKTRGYRVELGEIEASLAAHPSVLEGVAVPLPDPKLGNRLVASVVLRKGEQLDVNTLRNHCAARLPGYMVPEVFELRGELPRTSTGKVDRGMLRVEWQGREE
ncbi:MAG: amino acid adenylation domain-containing protein [Myxococcota bacterium]|nr:amino acid adenylation domain-containing protein [Myxococcota bacterium]